MQCFLWLFALGVFDLSLMSMQDPSDPTIGFLLDGMDRLCCLVRKYIAG